MLRKLGGGGIIGFGLVVTVVGGCAPKKDLTGSGARYYSKLQRAVVGPVWFEQEVYDDHQRSFLQLVREMRWSGFPVVSAKLVSGEQRISYENGALSQEPVCAGNNPCLQDGDGSSTLSICIHASGTVSP